jgi:hypothetical protein
MNLISVFNKNLPRAHIELEFDLLGLHEELVKYVVYLSKRKKIIFLHASCPNSSRRIFGLKEF